MRWIHESFAAKLFAGLLGTVGVLLTATWAVVQVETSRQVRETTDRATASAAAQFQLLEETRRQQTEAVARPLSSGRRIRAELEAANATGDLRYLTGSAIYEMDLANLPQVLVVFADPDATPILTLHGSSPMEGGDPARVAETARRVLEGDADELLSYRVLGDVLFSVRTRILADERAFGTLSLGIPVTDEDLGGIGRLLNVEVCIVVEGRCVVGTPHGREGLASELARMLPGAAEARIEALGREWSVEAQPLVADDPSQGTRVVAVPLDPVLAPFKRINRALFLGGGIALTLSVLVGVILSRGLTRPVRALVTAAGQVAQGDYDQEVTVSSRDEIGTLAAAFNQMTQDLRLKERAREILNKVTSPEVARHLLRDEVKLGGENRSMTVLFADIRGFSSLTEGMEPQRVIALLNQCMEGLSHIVDEEGGTVDKYVGDGLMAFWGTPVELTDHALRATRAALRMQRAMAALTAERRRRGEPPVEIGVGINSGLAVAGLMGSPDRWNYTVLGETVNLAARLCNAAGGGETVMTAETLGQVGPTAVAHSLGPRKFKGFTSEVEVFAVEGIQEPPTEGGRGRGIKAVLLAGLLAGMPGLASAQTLPTLRDAGAEYISPGGGVQVTLSGALDLEGLAFLGNDAGLAWGEGLLVAPRLRVFTDVFLGDHVYALLEGRADRGEAPRSGVEEARLEQAFLRFSNRAGSFSAQAGRFATPFGSYPLRHLTVADPFLRPPLPYDYPTMMCATIAPPTKARFLEWREEPETFRRLGAPPVWGVPYQWGAMVSGVVGAVSYRVAAMNSAPSSDPEAWRWSGDAMRHPSWVAGVGVQATPSLHLGASYDRGPWLGELKKGTLPAGRKREDYRQELMSVDLAFIRGPISVRAEVMRDLWAVPNVSESSGSGAYGGDVEYPVEWGGTLELQSDLGAGWSAAVRGGLLDFRPLSDGGTAVDWDYDMRRFEVALGYRLAQNAGILGTWMLNDQRSSFDPDDDLLGIRLWWEF